MEPLLPSLHNLPAFYIVAISLLIMTGLSGYALYRRLRHRPPAPGFAWLKGIVLLPLWVLCLFWTGLAPDPYRAKGLFEQALRDREDVVYEQQTGNGRAWQYTVKSVRHWLARVPESVPDPDGELPD